MIPLAGGLALGLVWGWLLVQRFARPLRPLPALLATAALAAEVALLADGGAAAALLGAVLAGGLLRTWLWHALARRTVAA